MRYFSLQFITMTYGVVVAVLPATVAAKQNAKEGFEPATERTPAVARFESLGYGIWFSPRFTAIPEEVRKLIASGKKPAKKVNFTWDTDQWVSTLKNAGIKYLTINVKSRNGWCLWDSQYTDFDFALVSEKDMLGDLVRSCQKHGMAYGFRYCYGIDAYNEPDEGGRGKRGMSEDDYFEFANNQIAELLTRYAPVSHIYITESAGIKERLWERLQRLYAVIKSKQPDCLLILHSNASLQVPALDVFQPDSDFPFPERHNPWISCQGKKYYIPLETSVWWRGPMLNRGTDSPRSIAIIYHTIVRQGCNMLLWPDFLLDIDGQGRIAQEQVDVLMKIKKAIDEVAVDFPLPQTVVSPRAGETAERFFSAAGSGETDDTIVSGPPWYPYRQQRMAIAKFNAVLSARQQLREQIYAFKTKDGKSVAERAKVDAKVAEKINALIKEAEMTNLQWEDDRKCLVTLRVSKERVEKLVGGN